MIRLAIAILIFSGQLAFAQAAKIRSGEHEDFSRLVISLPTASQWSFERQSGDYIFRIEGWERGFDTSEVFDLIPRTRVGNLKTDDASVVLELECNCDALAAAYAGSYVIIDIIDRELRAPRISMDDAVQAAADNRAQLLEPKRSTRLDQTAVTRIKNIGLENVQTEPDRVPADLNSTQKKLLEGLSRAAGLDLLRTSPALNAPTQINDSQPIVEVQAPEREMVENKKPEIPLELRAADRFRIRSAVDLARGEPEISNAPECTTDKDWEIAAWGNGEPYADQLAAMRGNLVGDISQVNLKTARDLVRLYLHFGLGAEAIQAAKSFDLSQRDVEIAQTIAGILEGQMSEKDAIPENALNCGSNQSMWHVLSHPSSSELNDTQTEELTSLFLAFPAHLKKMLGPKLIMALNQRGNKLTGKVLYSAISKSQQGQDPEVFLNSESSLEDLKDIIARNDETSPDAMVQFLQEMRKTSQHPATQDIVLAEAYRKQLGNTTVANELTNALLIAYSFKGDFPAAFSLVPEVNEDQLPYAVNSIAKDIAGHKAKVQVIEAVFLLIESQYLGLVSPENVKELTGRLMSIGIPSLTRDLINRTNSQDILTSELIQGLIAERQFAQAEQMLKNYDGKDHSNLTASLRLRRDRAASLAVSTIEELSPDDRNQAAWLSGNHELIAVENARKAAAKRLSEPMQEISGDVSLASMAAQVQRSSRTREIIADLLEEIN